MIPEQAYGPAGGGGARLEHRGLVRRSSREWAYTLSTFKETEICTSAFNCFMVC